MATFLTQDSDLNWHRDDHGLVRDVQIVKVAIAGVMEDAVLVFLAPEGTTREEYLAEAARTINQARE